MLQFNSDHQFKILQLTDLHYHLNEKQLPADNKTLIGLQNCIKLEQPDFVALTGDIIIAYKDQDPIEGFQELLRPIHEKNIPWAYIFGNHDAERGASKEIFLEAMSSYPNCLTTEGPIDIKGNSNFTLDIFSHESTDKNSATLYFLDSNDYAPEGQGKYGWIEQNQIEWFHKEVNKRKKSVNHPSLVFYHIPIPEYAEAWERGTNIVGSKQENVCSPTFNSGFYQAMQSQNDILACFVGHDHVNDFCANLDGLDLNYGRGGGYHTYAKEDFPQGARVINLTQDQSQYETWVRCYNGEIQNKHFRDPRKS